MPNVYTACWTMNGIDFGNTNRVANLERVALVADTRLKIMGRMAGGAFVRLMIVPEYFYESGAGLLSRGGKHAIYRDLKGISKRVPELILIAGSIAYGKGLFSTDTYNVCPVLYGGEIVKKLYKGSDDGVYQLNGTFRTKTDGNKSVPVATINGLTLGLDICLDYNRDRLSSYVQSNHLADPDMHIQISGTNATQSSRCVAKVNGIYIHCDQGGKGVNGATAWQVTARAGLNATTTRIQPAHTDTPAVGRVIYFHTPC